MSGRYRWNHGYLLLNDELHAYGASTNCPPYGRDAQLPLQLIGVRDGVIIKRLPEPTMHHYQYNQAEEQANAGGFLMVNR